MMGTATIAVRDVSKLYPSGDTIVHALNGVSLEVRPGELVGIVGPSGSGKSTMLLIAGLLEPPSTGEVTFRGEQVSHPAANLNRLRDFRRERVGFVFQKANLIPFLTAWENVALALEINDVPSHAARDRAIALLNELGLAHRADNRPSRLSGGEQQRVAIARAIANGPSLLLADEPTAALDGTRGRQVMNLFRAIADEHGTAVMTVTHDPRSLDLFDRIYEFEDGRIVS